MLRCGGEGAPTWLSAVQVVHGAETSQLFSGPKIAQVLVHIHLVAAFGRSAGVAPAPGVDPCMGSRAKLGRRPRAIDLAGKAEAARGHVKACRSRCGGDHWLTIHRIAVVGVPRVAPGDGFASVRITDLFAADPTFRRTGTVKVLEDSPGPNTRVPELAT